MLGFVSFSSSLMQKRMFPVVSPPIYLFCREAAARNSDAAYLGGWSYSTPGIHLKLANSWPIDDSGGKEGLHAPRIGKWSQRLPRDALGREQR